MTRPAYLVALIAIALLIGCGSDSESSQVSNASAGAVANVSNSISASDARSHIGERTTVCGNVVDSRYSTGSNGRPTILNFEKAYPNHPFVAVIWGDDRSKFPSKPENYYRGERVCATGLIELYSGKPEIIARSPSQLAIQ